MESMERQTDFDSAGQQDMLQALRSASLPDEFWMYSYKILPCPHGYRHSWTHCPFSHAGETARRRCPRTHNYLPDPCVNARAKRQCPNGDACPYAHNTFEQWLHPARYRTRLCYLGANCRRPTCFFAHSVEELRSVDENDSGSTAPPPSGPTLLPPLPMPPPLPAPPSSSNMPAHAEYGVVTQALPPPGQGPTVSSPPLPTSGPSAAAATAAAMTGPGAPPPGTAAMPMGLFQPIALVCMPQPQGQPHTMMRPDLMSNGTAPAGYVTFQARPGMPRPPAAAAPGGSDPNATNPALQPHGMHVPMAVTMAPPPPGALMPMTMRPQPRPPHGLGGQTVAVAAVHHGGQMHMTSAGPVYIHAGHMGAVPTLHVQPPPHGFAAGAAPYSSAMATSGGSGVYVNGGGYGSGEGAYGRQRSYSNPGESPFISANLTSPVGPRAYNSNGSGSGDQASSPVWYGGDTGRRSGGAPSSVTAVPASALSSGPSSPPHLTRGATAPRHMPAPTNRGSAVRRLSTPASLPATVVNAATVAAAATAAVAAMRYPEVEETGIRAAGGTLPNSHSASAALPPSAIQQQQPTQPASNARQLEAGFRSMSLSSKPVAAPPPTPAPSNNPGSPYSPSLSSSPLSVVALAANASVNLPTVTAARETALASPVNKTATMTVASYSVRSSVDGGAAATAGATTNYSRPSSSGSSRSGSSRANAFDSSAAAAALAAAAAAATAGEVQSDSVAVPYRALLQHVLRSASASAADPPHMLLPALLSGAGPAAADLTADADLMYNDVDGLERSSDPGPMGLRAAIRRISTEIGSAAVNRNSDPGQGMPAAAAADVQLLLPLLQSVLTEGLATGQFELVNGQLQVKGSASGTASGGGMSPSGGSGTYSAAAGASAAVVDAAAVVGNSRGVIPA